MAAPVPATDRRSSATIWVEQHLVARRTLPLAALILWGCLVMTGWVIHPVTPRGPVYQSAVPFRTALGAGIDYYQFWVVGRAREQLRPGNIYSPDDRRRMAELGRELLKSSPQPAARLAASTQFRERTIETFSTPFLYAVVNEFAIGRYDRDYDRFLDVCLAALMFSLVAIGWVLRFSLAESLLFAAATLVWCDPLASDLRVGNVNQLQLAGVALYLLLRRAPERLPLDLLSGVVLGLLVAFKPTLATIPMLLALAWVIDRRWTTLWRQGAAAVAAAAVAVVVGCRFLNSWSAWSDWISALSDLETVSDVSVQSGNYSLAQLVLQATGDPTGWGVGLAPILLTAMLVLAGVALFLTRPAAVSTVDNQQARRERDVLVTALGCGLSVVALKLVWLHYYVLLIPVLLYVLRPGGWIKPAINGRPRLLGPMAGLALALLALAAVFGTPFAVLLEPDPADQAVLSIGGAWGLMLLGLAGLWFPTAVLRQAKPVTGR